MNAVLARLVLPDGLVIDCRATGGAGDCGHPLAECPDRGCPGSFCPTCREWLCPDCQALRDAVQAELARGAAVLQAGS